MPPVVNSVQTNGSISAPLHKRDIDLQARGTHRKSDLVNKDTLVLKRCLMPCTFTLFKFYLRFNYF